ncbi:sigma-70 family RNA polymerase sigma factor [Micromonospora sp. NBC_01405]|uniref:RNA polymerase sigma factor n=1 Tax=Micromonospora sp. NBC_01405 TaxID=2903589 RepID=UPI0032503783
MRDNPPQATAHEPERERTRRIGSDRAALEAFYAEHYPDVVRYFTRRLRDPHDVADLVADTFIAAIGGATGFDPRRGRPLAWLLGIAHNTLRRFYRQREADRQVAVRFAGRRLLDADDIVRIEEQIDAEQRARRARGVLRELSTTDRELIELVDIAGLTPREAAHAMGLLPGTVRVRLFRARARLRTAYDIQEEIR